MTTDISARLKDLGHTLPDAARPSFNYTSVTVHQGVAYVSGQLPKIDGEIRVFGKVGCEVDIDQAREQAIVCILQAMACLEAELGSLDRVLRILKLNGYVASAAGFNDQPRVIDAASDLLVQVFGEAGRHARAAVGVAELPRNAAVEIDMVVAVRDD